MNRRTRAQTVVLGLLLAVACATVEACKEDDKRPPVTGSEPGLQIPGGSTEGGTVPSGDASAGDALVDAAVCTDLAASGSAVDQDAVVDDPPVPLGGIIVDGTYNLTTDTVYGVGASGRLGFTGFLDTSSIRITAGVIEQISITSNATSTPVTALVKSTYTVNGAALVTEQQCPTPGLPAQLAFTASPPNLVLLNQVTKEAFTFTIQ